MAMTCELNPTGWRLFPELLDRALLNGITKESGQITWQSDRYHSLGLSARQTDCAYINSTLPAFKSLVEQMSLAIAEANRFFKFELDGLHESLTLLRYIESDFVDWHYDLNEGQSATRKLSISVLLNDPSEYSGGEFELFPSTNLGRLPSGCAVVFPSYLPHRVTTVTGGTRIVATGFFSGPPFR
jgi:PKHD-type hydroxylase